MISRGFMNAWSEMVEPSSTGCSVIWRSFLLVSSTAASGIIKAFGPWIPQCPDQDGYERLGDILNER